MTEQEAITVLKMVEAHGSLVINAKELAIKALEKQIAVPHHHTRVDYIRDFLRVSVCPNCLSMIYTYKNEYPKHCTDCGQKLDWSEV